jgi:hypothetical protein
MKAYTPTTIEICQQNENMNACVRGATDETREERGKTLRKVFNPAVPVLHTKQAELPYDSQPSSVLLGTDLVLNLKG